MPNLISVTTEDGKQVLVAVSNIASIEAVPGKPGEPAVEAADEVADDPGEEPSATAPLGRPPKKGHPKVEAKAAVAGEPDTAILKLKVGGDLKVAASAKSLADAIG